MQSEHLIWLAVGFGVYTISWMTTNGGYACALPIFLLLFIYCNRHVKFRIQYIFRDLLTIVKENINCLIHKERLSVALIVIYWTVKAILMVAYPEGEKSNGSPVSLIFFTVLFITLFIVPKALVFMIQNLVNCFRKRSNAKIKFNLESAHWRLHSLVILVVVIVIYSIDGDITAILRYFAKGRPCWPLLIPRKLRDTLPYPLQHAWFQTWDDVFKGYHPHWILSRVTLLGREMGEVCHLLPVLIGTYCLSQVFISSKYSVVKETLFGCIAGVVLGGVTCGTFKMVFHRYRPNAYGNPYLWTGPGAAVVNHYSFSKLDLSFPAGHTTVTSATATCIYKTIAGDQQQTCKQKSLLLVIAYFYPFLVLFSRVGDCYHWTSDAAFGLFLGYLIGTVVMVTLRQQKKTYGKSPSTYQTV